MTKETLEGFSAKLLAVDPKDSEAVRELHGEMEAECSSGQSHLAAVQTLLDFAMETLKSVVDGGAEDAADSVDMVASAISTAVEQLECQDEDAQTERLQNTVEEIREIVDAVSDDAPATVVEETVETVDETPDTTDLQDADSVETPVVEDETPAAEDSSQSSDDGDDHADWTLPKDTDVELLGEFITECFDRIAQGEASLLELESNPDDAEQIAEIFRSFHTIKGTAGFLELNAIQKLAHLAENLLDRARDGQIRISGGYADLSLKSCDMLREMIGGLEGISPGGPLVKPARYDELLTQLSDPEAAGFGASESGAAAVVAAIGASQESDDDAVEEQPVRSQSTPRSEGQDASIRVSTARLDSLINMAGELVIAHSMVAQDDLVVDGSNPRLAKNVGHAGKIVRELQDLAMALRMVPLKGTFRKMQRLVRDLGRKAGKAVRFVAEGEETEIDRNMVEAINDPLVHMIRNALDHGLESTDERARSGKDATGTVALRAYHSAGNVVIELKDDGRGLDRDRIVAKAIERGVLEPGRELSDREAFGLIFCAGLSTAKKITNISGRGVGMDVVRSSIEALNGRVEVNSKLGEGTTITLRLPLTMAISDSMLLGVGSERFLLPIPFISQTFRPEPGALSTVNGEAEVVSLRGSLLPLFRLHKLFDIEDARTDPYEGLVVVIEAEGGRCALLVDEIIGQHQVVIKSLGPIFGDVTGVSGGAILGDGRIGLILDASGILNLARGTDPNTLLDQAAEDVLLEEEESLESSE